MEAMVDRHAKCTVTGRRIQEDLFKHKQSLGLEHYGILWPDSEGVTVPVGWDTDIPMIPENALAEFLGVKKVWIGYEGLNETGSMKDYLVKQAVKQAVTGDYDSLSVVSSGNHAYSLAKLAKQAGKKAVIYVPETTSKLPMLQSFENAIVVAVKDAVFEDVYALASRVQIDGVYNANVSNDFLMTGIVPAAKHIVDTAPSATHVVAGVGNGTFLSGLVYGFDFFNHDGIAPIAVGMKGAFPLETALAYDKAYIEYQDFREAEENIEAGEGSIALESYSMPQATYAIRKRKGFTLGGLLNQDITDAYALLVEKTESFKLGIVPESTGIMSLAACMKHRYMLDPSSELVLCFTGAGYKDPEGLVQFGGSYADKLLQAVQKDIVPATGKFVENTILASKDDSAVEIADKIRSLL